MQLIEDPDAHVRRVAISALEAIHPDPAIEIAAFAKALDDSDPAVRIAALSGLTDHGAAAVPALDRALGKPATRYWAALALGELGKDAKEAVNGLIAALKDDRPLVRREALIALGKIGPEAAPAVPAISERLADRDPGVRNSAAFALGRIGPAAMPAADVLRETLTKPEDLLATVSAWALARIEPENAEARKLAIEYLTRALSNKNPQVQVTALKGLIGLELEPAVMAPILAEAIAKSAPAAAEEAVGALPQLGDAAMPAMTAALKRAETRGQAAELLARLGPKAVGSLDGLAAALVDKDPHVRREVLFALAGLGSAASPAQGAIIKALDDPDERVRAVAAYALGQIGPSAVAVMLPQPRRGLEITSIRSWRH